ncbi:hypothetical protein COS83_00175 [archaeon CG07_land_8_20_14_0_80_38_8]|nr:MAG: hypothetical protein COS83_00175 [archaeon CG07_land_8_20_14_0_80_38_8]PIU88737.1 MAG: hypothetical protein COS64_02520 [archaeon CG06_land_8_20_14_3_00_37_11]
MFELLKESEIESILNNLSDMRIKASNQCLNKLYSYCEILKNYAVPLSKEFDNVNSLCQEVRKKYERKHHLPPLKVFSQWHRQIMEYFNFIKKNYKMMEPNSIIF